MILPYTVTVHVKENPKVRRSEFNTGKPQYNCDDMGRGYPV